MTMCFPEIQSLVLSDATNVPCHGSNVNSLFGQDHEMSTFMKPLLRLLQRALLKCVNLKFNRAISMEDEAMNVSGFLHVNVHSPDIRDRKFRFWLRLSRIGFKT
nr:uncharacterized protein LOC127292372 [Lolium perenne]XP_051226180.1 uncharacterized protein LOC127343994 [Lolium perenne]